MPDPRPALPRPREGRPRPPEKPVPFRSASEAWLWTARMLAARRDGAGAAFGTGGVRPCEPDDVLKVLDQLYRQQRITLAQAAVMRAWGDKDQQPTPAAGASASDISLWDAAMRAMDAPLRRKGIVG